MIEKDDKWLFPNLTRQFREEYWIEVEERIRKICEEKRVDKYVADVEEVGLNDVVPESPLLLKIGWSIEIYNN